MKTIKTKRGRDLAWFEHTYTLKGRAGYKGEKTTFVYEIYWALVKILAAYLYEGWRKKEYDRFQREEVHSALACCAWGDKVIDKYLNKSAALGCCA